jgi:hypothetical protein
MEKKIMKAELQFVSIDILERSILVPENIKEAPANFNFNINVSININESDSFVIPKVSIVINEKEGGIQFGKIVVNNVIKVNNLNEFLINNGDKNSINQELINKLTETAISTTRGVMWDSFRGTFLHGAILPIIDTSQNEFTNK